MGKKPVKSTHLKIIADLLILVGPGLLEMLSGKWKKVFKARNFLILGHRGTGKTALLLFMRNNRPQEKDGKDWVSPNPTSGKDDRDAKFDVDSDKRIKVNSDVGGDPVFRELWKEALKAKPEGMIYMIDGRISDEEMNIRMDEMFKDGLSHCDHDRKLPHTVHVFLNFADQWGRSESDRRRRCRHVEDLFEARAKGNLYYENLRFHVSPTSLEAGADRWPETESALKHFAAIMNK